MDGAPAGSGQAGTHSPPCGGYGRHRPPSLVWSWSGDTDGLDLWLEFMDFLRFMTYRLTQDEEQPKV